MVPMNATLVINTKGGVGKTTVTTNLASYFAANGVTTTIMDYDPQGSSLHWLRQRPEASASIHGANAAPQHGAALRSIGKFVPPNTRQLIIDAPAGASRLLLQEMLSKANCILVPVAPSAIDIHATANFIKDLLLMGRIRARKIRLAVVANRVRSSGAIYEPLERFVNSLGMPMLTQISDSDVYIDATERGIGVFEMYGEMGSKEREEFMPIVDWVDGGQRLDMPRSGAVVPLRQHGTERR